MAGRNGMERSSGMVLSSRHDGLAPGRHARACGEVPRMVAGVHEIPSDTAAAQRYSLPLRSKKNGNELPCPINDLLSQLTMTSTCPRTPLKEFCRGVIEAYLRPTQKSFTVPVAG